MVIRVSDKTQNYSKVTKLLVKPNVNSFRFKGDGKISGFYIKDMSVMGYESNSKYEVGDYENDEIEFYCSDIEIKKIGKIEF